jgi:hypothetical protein
MKLGEMVVEWAEEAARGLRVRRDPRKTEVDVRSV